MKKMLVAIACLALCGASVLAAPARLEPNEVSASNLKSILGGRFGTSIDDDGMVIVKKGKYLQVNIQIDSKDNRLTFYHGWSAKPSLDRLKCLEKVNQWNIDRAFNCLIYDHDKKAFIWCYYLTYSDGIHAKNLLDTVGVLLDNEEVFVKTFYEAGMLE